MGLAKRAGQMEMDQPGDVAIMATALEIDCQFVFNTHANSGRAEGVSEDTTRAIAEGTAPQGLLEEEELVVRFTQELLRERKISDATFNAVKDRFGVQWTVELTGLICYYMMLGLLIMAFEEELPQGLSPELPL